jgi:hypothetical protein
MSARARWRCRRPQTPRKNPREILVVVGLPTVGFFFPRHSKRSLRSETLICIARFSCDAYLFATFRAHASQGGRDRIVFGGHDFSRAVHRPKFQKALAPEESFRIVVTKIWGYEDLGGDNGASKRIDTVKLPWVLPTNSNFAVFSAPPVD